MSTNTEPVVAHYEKSKFVIFFPEISHGKPRNVVWIFSWNMFLRLKARKKSKIRYGPTAGQKHAKFSD